jgi:ABC-2 type transport system permease protein
LAEPLLISQDDKTAAPPYIPARASSLRILRQYLVLLLVLLAEYRTTWFYQVFTGLLVPIGFAFFIKSVGGAMNAQHATFLIGGNMAASIAFGPTSFLISKIGWARQTGEFNYWIALPMPKLILVFAIISVALVFALPGLIGVYILGSLMLGLPLTGAWALIPLLPLGVLPLAGLGTLLGTYAPDGQTANIFGNVLIIFIGFLSPMMLPPESLPVPLRIIANFVPTTYVADSFRMVISGNTGKNLIIDVVVLILFSIVLLTLSYKRLDWRAT